MATLATSGLTLPNHLAKGLWSKVQTTATIPRLSGQTPMMFGTTQIMTFTTKPKGEVVAEAANKSQSQPAFSTKNVVGNGSPRPRTSSPKRGSCSSVRSNGGWSPARARCRHKPPGRSRSGSITRQATGYRLWPTEITQLQAICQASTSGAFSVNTAPCGSIHSPICALYFGASYCSCGADIAGFALYEDYG